MNRYELGRRVPSPDFVIRLGKVLNVPAAYFYAVEEDEAELLLAYHRLSPTQRQMLASFLAGLGSD
jgi:transcriptional regulator with XRE-family HTH domain